MPYVAVMLVAGSVEYVEPPRAGHLGDTPINLLDVSYKYVVTAPNAEPPHYVESFRLYIRWFRTENEEEESAKGSLGLRLWSIDDPQGPSSVLLGNRAVLPLGNAPTRHQVYGLTYLLRGLKFPRRGRYRFDLGFRPDQKDWRGQRWRRMASTFIEIG